MRQRYRKGKKEEIEHRGERVRKRERVERDKEERERGREEEIDRKIIDIRRERVREMNSVVEP